MMASEVSDPELLHQRKKSRVALEKSTPASTPPRRALSVLSDYRVMDKFDDAVASLFLAKEILWFGNWQNVTLIATIFIIVSRQKFC